jgi:hypothetical protein
VTKARVRARSLKLLRELALYPLRRCDIVANPATSETAVSRFRMCRAARDVVRSDLMKVTRAVPKSRALDDEEGGLDGGGREHG